MGNFVVYCSNHVDVKIQINNFYEIHKWYIANTQFLVIFHLPMLSIYL